MALLLLSISLRRAGKMNAHVAVARCPRVEPLRDDPGYWPPPNNRIRETPVSGDFGQCIFIVCNSVFKVVEKGAGAGLGACELASMKRPEHDPSSFLSPWCTAQQTGSVRMNFLPAAAKCSSCQEPPGVPSTVSHAIAVVSTRERAFLSAQIGRLPSAKPDE